MAKVDTFRHSTLTHEDVINHLRNALSHPTELHVEADYPSTGYTTPGGTAYITDFVFVDSPDVRGDRPILHRKRDVAERALRDMGNPSNLRIQEIKRGNSISYQIWNHEDKPYVRIFKIDIPVTSLKALVLGLSNHLSQPMQNNWDGETINQLLVR